MKRRIQRCMKIIVVVVVVVSFSYQIKPTGTKKRMLISLTT